MRIRRLPRNRTGTEHLALVVEPATANPGATISLRCDGFQSGRWGATLLARASDGGWAPVYALNLDGTVEKYPLPEREGPILMQAVAVVGPVQVTVPPVEQGRYRIERSCFSPTGSIEQRVAVGYLNVL